MLLETKAGNPKPNELEEQFPIKPLHRVQDNLLVSVQMYCGMMASVAIMLVLAYEMNGYLSGQYKILAIVNALLIQLVFKAKGVYRHSTEGVLNARRFIRGLWVLTKAWCIVVATLALLTFYLSSDTQYQKQVLITWAIFSLVSHMLVYCTAYLFTFRRSLAADQPIRTLVIGTNAITQQLVETIRNNRGRSEYVVGTVAKDQLASDEWEGKVPILGNYPDISKLVEQQSIRRVYITLLRSESSEVEALVKSLAGHCVDIIWIPDVFNLTTLNHRVGELSGLPLLILSGSPLMSNQSAFYKTLMDKSIALLMLILLSPIMLLAALAVKLTSPGPVLFKQQRHGWDGSLIEVFKFRSMYTQSNRNGKFELAKRNDPRVTTVGKFMRRTSIDELPQLINVLQGSMSLVGPRPHAVEVNRFYSQHIPDLMLRHRIKPGITGLAQINGCRGGDDCSTKTLDVMEKRISYDIEYINRWSMWLDFKILLLTPFKMFSKNAY